MTPKTRLARDIFVLFFRLVYLKSASRRREVAHPAFSGRLLARQACDETKFNFGKWSEEYHEANACPSGSNSSGNSRGGRSRNPSHRALFQGLYLSLLFLFFLLEFRRGAAVHYQLQPAHRRLPEGSSRLGSGARERCLSMEWSWCLSTPTRPRCAPAATPSGSATAHPGRTNPTRTRWLTEVRSPPTPPSRESTRGLAGIGRGGTELPGVDHGDLHRRDECGPEHQRAGHRWQLRKRRFSSAVLFKARFALVFRAGLWTSALEPR